MENAASSWHPRWPRGTCRPCKGGAEVMEETMLVLMAAQIATRSTSPLQGGAEATWKHLEWVMRSVDVGGLERARLQMQVVVRRFRL